jgi:3-dehydroquinate dehydratase-1
MDKILKTVTIKGLTLGEGMPKVCMPLVGGTVDELMSGADEVLELQPDIVEWRVDFFSQAENAARVLDTLKKLRQKNSRSSPYFYLPYRF